MKKQIVGSMIAAAIGVVGLLNMDFGSKKKDELSALNLANIEALAQGESGGGSSSNWSCWSQEEEGYGYWRCGNPCTFIDGRGGKGSEGKCYSN